MDINVSYDSSTANAPSWFKTAVTTAVNALDALFTNAIAITVDFGWGEENNNTIPTGAVSSSQSFGNYFNYSTLVAAMGSAATSADDKAAVASLGTTDPTHGGQIYVSSAEQKALGLRPASASGVDGYVGLDSALNWSTNPGGAVAPGSYDPVGAIEHELSEVMGRVGFLGSLAGPGVYGSTDLFRYSAPGARDLTPGAGFFSVDGQTMLTAFNNPTNGGDAADWIPTLQGDSFGDAYAGVGGALTATDLRMMDVLGYTLSTGGAATVAAASGATGTGSTGTGSTGSGSTGTGSTGTGGSGSTGTGGSSSGTGGGSTGSSPIPKSGGNTGKTYVFTAHPGNVTEKGFAVTGAEHGILSFAASSFSSIADILAHTKQVGNNTVITIDAKDHITLAGVSAATLRAHHADFSLHA